MEAAGRERVMQMGSSGDKAEILGLFACDQSRRGRCLSPEPRAAKISSRLIHLIGVLTDEIGSGFLLLVRRVRERERGWLYLSLLLVKMFLLARRL